MTPHETLERLNKRLLEVQDPIEQTIIRNNILFWEKEVEKINELNVYNFTVL